MASCHSYARELQALQARTTSRQATYAAEAALNPLVDDYEHLSMLAQAVRREARARRSLDCQARANLVSLVDNHRQGHKFLRVTTLQKSKIIVAFQLAIRFKSLHSDHFPLLKSIFWQSLRLMLCRRRSGRAS
jgi:hypothetical protein